MNDRRVVHPVAREVEQEIAHENKHVLLVIDNCPGHPRDLNLSNISIKFPPPVCAMINYVCASINY